MNLPELVRIAVSRVVGTGPVALHEPHFAGREWLYVKECLDSGYVSSIGKFVDRFEAELAEYTGAKHAVAVVNGTAALHIALQLAGVRAGDEVLIPTLTFVATASAVVYCGAIPHFVESEERTLGMDPHALREYLGDITDLKGGHCVNTKTGRVIRAIVPVHTFGHPLDIEQLMAVARDFRLVLVEDAAEALGSFVSGQHSGTFGLIGILSFNGNKTVTTGGGGAILTNEPGLAKRAKHLTTTAKIPHPWEYVHDEVGYNYRLPNINAAIGCAQLEQLASFLASKRRIYHRYRLAFAEVPKTTIVSEREGCLSNYWLQTLLLDPSVADQRDSIIRATNDAGYRTRPSWSLIHRLAPYRECPKMKLPIAESLDRRLINLPSSVRLDPDET